MDIPDEYIIHDIRSGKDFKGITICGYKRRDVLNAFQNSIINNKIEDAIRWCVELHSTGLNKQIWESFDSLYIKYIHVNNPKLFFYLSKRKKEYLNIIKKFPKKHELFTRNNQEIRNLYAELTAILSLTKKNNLFLPKSLPPIKNTSFETYEIKKRMISKNLNYIMNYTHNSTLKETQLALNEIINNLLYTNGTFQNCLFWYLWLEKFFQKNRDIIKNNIVFENVNLTKDEQYFDHWTFILWNIILSFEKKIDKNNFIIIKKMEEVYKKDFKPTSINKKKYYFFISFYIIKNNISWNILLYPMEHLIIQTNANINSMYKNIVTNIESNMSSETRDILYKKYNQLFFNLNESKKNIEPKKIKNTSLDEDINKVLFTESPDYYNLKKSNQNKHSDELISEELNKKKLIHKNKTQRDIIEQKMEEKNKRIEAFSNFIAYKKKENKDNQNTQNISEKKTVIDYYKDIEYKNINSNNKEEIINKKFKNKSKKHKYNNHNDDEDYNDDDEDDDYFDIKTFEETSKDNKNSKKYDKQKFKIEKI